MNLVLFAFIFKWFEIHHTRTLLVYDWRNQLSKGNFICRYILTSSAERQQYEYLFAPHKSFMKKLKRSGPRTDPCGQRVTLRTVWKVRHDSKHGIYFLYFNLCTVHPFTICIMNKHMRSLMFIPCISDVLEEKTNNMH
jgi:hypothetical protein